nr:hypothetical protein [Planctomycetota bacterium]
EVEALRAKVLARTEGVRELDEHNARVAMIYAAITDVLSGKDDAALQKARAALKTESSREVNSEKQDYFGALDRFVEQSERAAKRARQDHTLWDVEMEKEIKAGRPSP